jgi:hypothetical protein
MEVTPAGMVMSVRALAPENALIPMDVSWLPSAKVTLVRLLAFLNAYVPMDVTVAGMVIAVSALAASNAPHPIDVTSAGIVALPAQSFCPVTTLSVIVNVPPIEHATVVVAACATVPCNPNKIMLMRRSDTIRLYIFSPTMTKIINQDDEKRQIKCVFSYFIIVRFFIETRN